MSLDLWQKRYRGMPARPVRRELLTVESTQETVAAPVLCVSGDPKGAGLFAANWLPHIAAKGRDAHAVSVRGQGGTPKSGPVKAGQVHDLVQAAAGLNRQPVLIGHGRGALLVSRALARYPAAAAVLLAPRGIPKTPDRPVGNPRILIAGSPDDRSSPERTLAKVATAYGGAPLFFPGMGHDFTGQNGWQPVLDAILAWLNESS